MDGLKKRLDEAKGKWVDKSPHVLWAYYTILRKSIGETPFFMTYSSKAIILLEISFSTIRTDQFDSDRNEQLLSTSLDLI